MKYSRKRFLIFIRFTSIMGHYILFIRIPFYFIYVSSFPTVMLRRFSLCDYNKYKIIIDYWQRNLNKPNMISYPESKDIRKKLFKELVKKPDE